MIALHLLKHPLDCTKCDKAGDCFLQKFSAQTKLHGFSHISGGGDAATQYKKFAPGLLFDSQKCIGCQKCIRFFRDVMDDEAISLIPDENGNHVIDLYPGKVLNDNYYLNLVDLCPAGAFLDRNSVFQPAACDLMRTESISTESSVGVNTYVLHRDNKIFRIIPRENKHVNGAWMTNSARGEHREIEEKKRLTQITCRGKKKRMEIAIAQVLECITNDTIAVVCSGNMSLEDQFMLRRFLDIVPSETFFLKKTGKSDNFLMSDDATPNFNGAVLMSLVNADRAVSDLESLNEKIQNGIIKKILVINEEIFSMGVSYVFPEGVEILYVGTEINKTSLRASVMIPVTTVFESTGTFINKDWRLQKFHKAINAPNRTILPLWYVMSLLIDIYKDAKTNDVVWLDDVWKSMSKTMTALANVDFFHISHEGVSVPLNLASEG
jgi:NADH-quinone oxidoreductase subunit G